jgi:hypothetical protein
MDNQKPSEWQPYQAQTDGVPMVDSGTGQPFILKTYEYLINPKRVKELEEKGVKMTNQDLFNMHWPHIRSDIWSSGLVAIQDEKFPPRVVVGKRLYRIFVLCEPKFRRIVHDTPKTLQEIFKKTNKKV